MNDKRDEEIPLNRVRRGGRPAKPKLEPAPPRIPRIARLAALAIKFRDMVDRGAVRDYAALASLGYITRARMTQIMGLLNLAPELLDNIMLDPNQVGALAIPESRIRRITNLVLWQDQLDAWEQLLTSPRRAARSISSKGGIVGADAPDGKAEGKVFPRGEKV